MKSVVSLRRGKLGEAGGRGGHGTQQRIPVAPTTQPKLAPTELLVLPEML